MKWFKHDSDAHMDAKIRRLIHRFGIEAYGVYWYCLELIAHEVTSKKMTFELEHDSEIIAHDLKMSREKVEDMISFMVSLELFEASDNRLFCLKLLKRLDLSQGGSDKFRQALKIKKQSQSHDSIMTESCQSHEKEVDLEVDLEKNKTLTSIDQNSGKPILTPVSKIRSFTPKSQPEAETIREIFLELCPALPQPKKITERRKREIAKRCKENPEAQSTEFWRAFFCRVTASDFLTGRSTDFSASFDWLINKSNFQKVIEGNYDNRQKQNGISDDYIFGEKRNDW